MSKLQLLFWIYVNTLDKKSIDIGSYILTPHNDIFQRRIRRPAKRRNGIAKATPLPENDSIPFHGTSSKKGCFL